MPQNEPRATGSLEEIGRRDHAVTSEYRIFGPPGTGKTTNLTRQIHRAVNRYGADSVLVTSFSRTAAAELAGRDLPISRERVGTLHSHCWHVLGGPEIAESNVSEWNRDNPALTITPSKKHSRLEGEEAAEDDSETEKPGDRELKRLSRFRGLMFPREGWPATLVEFDKRWTEYKRENGLLDFTDLIDVCQRDVHAAPRNPSVIFADEAQDLNRMQLKLIRKWGERAEYFIICGDDDQCQPPGTMVRTTQGDVPIEALDPDRHRLLSYAPLDGVIYGTKRGFRFRKARRDSNYVMLTVRAGDRTTRCTPEHRFYVRWHKGDALERAHVVYLMACGNRFRVGWCKLMRADGAFHLGDRARKERADAAWILRVFYDRTEASIYESFIAAKYGLPLVTFEPINGAQHYSRQSLDRLFEMLPKDIPIRAADCLLGHGRDPRFPLYTKERAAAKRGGSTQFITEAANLEPDIMALPLANGHRVDWQRLSVSVDRYCGPVYSLDVEKYHTYIADGIITHNCIYTFTGASPEAFLDPDIPEDHKIVLKQSYRVPRAVHGLAEDLIRRVARRQAKEYLPRPADGSLVRLSRGGYKSAEYAILNTAIEHLERGKSVMFLTSCGYMLRPITAVLRKQGIPFHNPYRKSNGFWNPLRQGSRGSTVSRILSLLIGHPEYGPDHRPWTHGDLAAWAELLQAKGVLRHGIKKTLGACDPEATVTMERLDAIFEPEAIQSLMVAWDKGYRELLEWWRARVTADVHPRVQFPADIAARRGPEGLAATPQVIVGTVHSVKGGQADVVYLFPDLSQAGAAQYARGGAARDSVIRQFYVGATRAQEGLYICRAESSQAIGI